MSVSSDSEDEEEKRKLSLAVDPDFCKRVDNSNHEQSNGASSKADANSDANRLLPSESKRAKFSNDCSEMNEFTKMYSLDITPDGQKFIAKQLAKSLDEKIKEITSIPSQSCNQEANQGPELSTGIRLFATSNVKITEKDLIPSLSTNNERKRIRRTSTQKKKKRGKSSNKTTNDSSEESSSESEAEKLKSVAVTAEWVIKQ